MATDKKSELIKKVEQSLDTLRPYLNKDGGDVEVIDITDDGVVQVKLMGACESCPQSFMTMKAGIEEAVKKAVPQIESVVSVNTEAV